MNTRKIRQFEHILQTRPPGITATKDGIMLGIIDESGNPTPKVYKVNDLVIINKFSGSVPETIEALCITDRLRVSITCYFIALADIEKVSMDPIVKNVQQIIKKYPPKLARNFIINIVNHVENTLLQDEHYEDLSYWMPVKSRIQTEMQKLL